MSEFKPLAYVDYLNNLAWVEFEDYNPLDRNFPIEVVTLGVCEIFQKQRSSRWVTIVHNHSVSVEDSGPGSLRRLSGLPEYQFPFYGLAGEDDWNDPTKKQLRFLRELWREAGRLYKMHLQYYLARREWAK